MTNWQLAAGIKNYGSLSNIARGTSHLLMFFLLFMVRGLRFPPGYFLSERIPNFLLHRQIFQPGRVRVINAWTDLIRFWFCPFFVRDHLHRLLAQVQFTNVWEEIFNGIFLAGCKVAIQTLNYVLTQMCAHLFDKVAQSHLRFRHFNVE